MATAGGSFADIRTQAMTARSAAQDNSSKCRIPRCVLQTSPYDVRKTTKISTTCRLSIRTCVFCTYYRELRTIECTYYREMTVATRRLFGLSGADGLGPVV